MITPLREIRAGLVLPFMESAKAHQHRTNQYVSADRRVSADERKIRLEERDRRLADDTRTETQRLLGDPPSAQSVLGRRMRQANLDKIIRDLIDTLRR